MALQNFLLVVAAALATFAHPTDDLNSCLKNALKGSGKVAIPGDLFYQASVNRYNLNIPVTPAAVTFPT